MKHFNILTSAAFFAIIMATMQDHAEAMLIPPSQHGASGGGQLLERGGVDGGHLERRSICCGTPQGCEPVLGTVCGPWGYCGGGCGASAGPSSNGGGPGL